eukprot:SAG25_NODE_940_length_4665_cov_9.337495_2_plen_96_part_00
MVDTFLKSRDPVTPVTPVIEVWLEKQIGQEVQNNSLILKNKSGQTLNDGGDGGDGVTGEATPCAQDLPVRDPIRKYLKKEYSKYYIVYVHKHITI